MNVVLNLTFDIIFYNFFQPAGHCDVVEDLVAGPRGINDSKITTSSTHPGYEPHKVKFGVTGRLHKKVHVLCIHGINDVIGK